MPVRRIILAWTLAALATLALSGCHLGHRAAGGYYRPAVYAPAYRPAPATRVVVVRR